MPSLILISVFVVAICSLIYELMAGTLASYLLGDSVLQFSTVIGTYMFALGVGSWLSKYLVEQLETKFVRLQTSIGLCGGLSAGLLFLIFGASGTEAFRIILYLIVFIIGMLSGLEVPLLLRILKDKLEFKELVSQVLSIDYIGSLLASILFPIVLVPYLGLVRTAAFFGAVNVGVALAFLHLLNIAASARRRLKIEAWLALMLLGLTFFYANSITSISEESLYSDNIIYTENTLYQRLVLTEHADDLRLYLNNNLQFSSRDEYRYHEALVHPPMTAAKNPRRVLIFGGGDGLAAREVLSYPQVETVTLVDLDPGVTELFKTHPTLRALNKDSLNSPKVTIVNEDAFVWINSCHDLYDVIIIDFPDPSSFSVGKLYTTTFFGKVRSRLSAGGACSIQCTSPYFARKSFWCIATTWEACQMKVRPYHVYVPSFGDWGFCLVTHRDVPIPECHGRRYLNPTTSQALFEISEDMKRVPTEANYLHNQILVHYYDEDWQNLME